MKISNLRGMRSGYTLIEMTIVLFIILAFLAMSVPFFSKFSSSTGIKTAQREVATILKTARSYAISRNENYEVLFDTATTPNSYSIRRSVDPTVPIDKIYQLPSGVSFSATATVTFTANGGLTSGSATSVTVTSASATKQVTVETATGAVIME